MGDVRPFGTGSVGFKIFDRKTADRSLSTEIIVVDSV